MMRRWPDQAAAAESGAPPAACCRRRRCGRIRSTRSIPLLPWNPLLAFDLSSPVVELPDAVNRCILLLRPIWLIVAPGPRDLRQVPAVAADREDLRLSRTSGRKRQVAAVGRKGRA